LETITKTTAMVMMAGLMMAAPACADEPSTKSKTVPAPSAPEVVQRRARAIEVKVL